MPLYATPFTAGLIAGKLEEEGLTGQVELNIVERDGWIDLGPFRVEFIALAHSIPEGNALLIETPYGRIFHTGDWKIDETPVLGEPSSVEAADRDRRRGRARAGLRFDQRLPGQPSGPRPASTTACSSAVAEARGRVLVTTFASNAARLQTLGQVATKPAARSASPAARSTASCGWPRAIGYLLDFPEPIASTRR